MCVCVCVVCVCGVCVCVCGFSEKLVQMAFQCLQLVVTDYLPAIGSDHLEVVVEVAARFGLQTQELNVSLTAIGLLVSAAATRGARNLYFDQTTILIGQNFIHLHWSCLRARVCVSVSE